jgi:RNA polymerase sigma factor (sigma-70 family)
MHKPNRIPKKRKEKDIECDLMHVRAISDGSLTEWHQFINRYSGLIHGILRRYLVVEDEDEIRSVYVDILKSLYEGGLKAYRGEARLSTWLSVYTRSRALDFFRQRHGRYRTPRGYDDLTGFDREVLRLYFIEKLPLEVTVHMLRCKGRTAEAEDIIESIQRIDNHLDPRYLRRLDYEHHAKKYGVDSVKMLKYLIQQRIDYEERGGGGRPDARLIEEDVKETAERVRLLLSRLTLDERKIIYFRFNRGWSAKEIAERTELGGQRRIYTLIDRVIRKLRKNFSFGEK